MPLFGSLLHSPPLLLNPKQQCTVIFIIAGTVSCNYLLDLLEQLCDLSVIFTVEDMIPVPTFLNGPLDGLCLDVLLIGCASLTVPIREQSVCQCRVSFDQQYESVWYRVLKLLKTGVSIILTPIFKKQMYYYLLN